MCKVGEKYVLRELENPDLANKLKTGATKFTHLSFKDLAVPEADLLNGAPAAEEAPAAGVAAAGVAAAVAAAH